MPTPPVSILIVDDHGLVREGLRTLLDAERDLEVVGEAGTADEALALARQLSPDLIVLDVRLPDRAGLQLCGEIRELLPDVRILVCPGLADGSVLVEAARQGADGFVSKEAANAEIVGAVRRVAGGASVVGAASADAVFRHVRAGGTATTKLGTLTAREREVLAFLVWIEVSDDGVGVLPQEAVVAAPGHLGLAAMRERAEMAGGSCELRSLPGGGTTLTVWVPYEAPANVEPFDEDLGSPGDTWRQIRAS